MRRHLTYANVIATLALCLALGGTSYAAVAITGKQVRNSSLTGADIKNSSLTGADVKGRSIQASDLSTGVIGQIGKTGATGKQGPAGPQGAAGPVGPQGPIGPSTVYALSTTEEGDISTTAGGVVTASKKITLPEGIYALTAKVQLSSMTPVTVTCGLKQDLDNGFLDESAVTIPGLPSTTAPARASAIAALQSFTGRSTTFTCSGPATGSGGSSTGLQIGTMTMQAVKAGSFVYAG